MSSTQRVVLTVVICTGLLIAWQYLFAPKRKAPTGQGGQGTGQKAGSKAGGTGEKPAKPAEKTPTVAKAATVKERDPALGPISNSAEGNQITLSIPGGKVTFSDNGATIRRVVLDHPRYKEHKEGKLVPVDLVTTPDKKGPWQVETTFVESQFTMPPDAKFTVKRRNKREVLYQWESAKVRVSKHYVVDKTRPQVWLTVAVRNLTSEPMAHHLQMSLYNEADKSRGKPGIANPYPRIATGLCFVNDEIHRRSVAAITGEGGGCTAAGCGMGEGVVSSVGDVAWIGSDDRYFLTAIVPQGEDRDRRCELNKVDGRDMVVAKLRFSRATIAPGKALSRRFVVYAGAKELSNLDLVKGAANSEAKLSESIEFGWFAVLCRPMLAMLRLFHSILGNWGIAIILLTIFVKALTYYPTAKSMRSMKAMQHLKPKIDELREKYKDDKQRLNQEMMQLYKLHKVNPFGGCLPMLLQMPIWFALYRTLGNAVELYRSPFGGWITDLTTPDPYYVLPIAMGIAMYGQQALAPQPMEGTQAKMMKYFMPGMFTVMMLWLPSGLTLYIFVNTLLTAAQQWYMNKNDPLAPKKGAGKKSAPEGGKSGGGGKPSETSNRRRPRSGPVATPAAQGADEGGGGGQGQRSKKKRRRKRPKRT